MNTRTALPPSPPATRRPGRLWPKIALAGVLAVALAGAALWYFVLRHDAPPAVSLDSALAGIEASTPTPSPAPAATAPAPSADPATTAPATGTAAAPSASAAARPTDGRWTIDRSITNAQGTGSFAGFRIDEVLVRVGSATAVGRTAAVQGTMAVSGTRLTAAEVSVDLTDLETDDPRRDDAVQRALATSRFPNATFVLTQPVDVGTVPAPGQRISVAATGDLTIKGVTRNVTVDLQAQLQGDVLVVVGSAPIVLADHGVNPPSGASVVSVEDHGIFEFQLYFKKA